MTLIAVLAVGYVKSAPLEDYGRGCEDKTGLTPTLGAENIPVFGKTLF
jgi:hypothetical protein